MAQSVNGILLLDKPKQLTSNAALQRVKRLLQAKKAGHTGSLDPLATGMLPICFGEATKFSQFLLNADKSYHVVAKLGEKTTTGDAEGMIISSNDTSQITLERIESILPNFRGAIMQIPPMFSAIKHQGKPLYELARRGIEIERQQRPVQIFSLRIEMLQNDLLSLYVHCSKGTYIRTLVEDIGTALGCDAHVQELRRLTVTPYNNRPMISLKTLEQMDMPQLLATLLPVETAVEIYPSLQLSTASAFYLKMGQAVRASLNPGEKWVRLVAENGRFMGVGEVLEDGRIKPLRLVANI